ncbi:MAG TPA: hypothetical protein VFU23_04475, partial [Gemmatimonadales bacterium]|nr:hypothetical protein [Gemmatimonadales bacterium]
DPARLRALGVAVLPAELGASGVERAVAEFERWLAGYREGAELLHGYGTGDVHYAGPSPALKWSAQLADLDAAARKRHGASFATRSRAEREALVRAALGGISAGGLPQIDRAPHIALGLLAHFYSSAAAQDLCYRARIGKGTCRPLADSPRRPLPLNPA